MKRKKIYYEKIFFHLSVKQFGIPMSSILGMVDCKITCNSGLNWQNPLLRNTIWRMGIQGWDIQELNPNPSG
jgi:hypothetical protein